MNQKKRTKLCTNCDGLIDLDVIVCPYCGSDVLEITEPQQNSNSYTSPHYKKNLSPEETLSSLYPPPYQPKDIQSPDLNESIKEEVIEEEEIKKENSKFHSLLSTLFFSLGVNFLFFGFYLFLFSKNKELFLRLDASLWYVYVLIGGPLLFFGYKMFSKKY